MKIIKRLLCFIIAFAVILQINTLYSSSFEHPANMEFGAHRGVECFAPENSVPAYSLAGEEGWEWAWIAQIKYSADGTLYVMHDNTVDRTTDGTGDMSTLTDEYINSLHINYCPEHVYYNLDDFDEEELHIPTLDEIVGICSHYKMKMCFRLGTMPVKLSSDKMNLWESFKNILEKYNVSIEDCTFSGLPAQVKTAASIFGDIEYSCYISSAATAQDYINWFNDPAKNAGVSKKSAIIKVNVLDKEQVQLLHDNDIKVYAYLREYFIPTMNEIREYESWGIDVLQNSGVNYTDDESCKHAYLGLHVFLEPTCKNNGRGTVFCYLCGKHLDYIDVPATGHTPGEWITDAEPTYTSEGIRNLHCSTCNEIIDSETIPKLIRVGWHQIDGDDYYFSSNGTMKTGWLCIEEDSGEISKYYFGSDGKMQIGHQTIGEKKYYFDESGKMQTGWQTIEGKTYCISSGGVLYTGWRTLIDSDGDYSKYYFGPDGAMRTGRQTIGGKNYCFDSDGTMQTGWKSFDGKTYYYDTRGIMKTGLWSANGKKYYFGSDGSMYVKCLISVDGNKYYMGSDGAAYTNRLISVDGNKYYMGKDGIAYKSRLISLDGKKYYLGKDGIAYKNRFASLDGKKYYFGSNGVMYKSRLASINSKKYYFGSDGVMYKSRLASINSKKYYFGSDGIAYKNRLISLSGKKYYIGSDCIAYKNKWAELEGKHYYFGNNCVMLTDTMKRIGNKTYIFNSNGICINY